VAKDDEIITGDDVRISFEIEGVATDGKTGKPVADITRYTYRDGDACYIVTFERQKTIVQGIFTDFDGAYHRFTGKVTIEFTGKVTIEKFEKDLRVEIFDDHAIGELMYLGRALSPTL
jgi:hypothetical protein